MLSGVHPFEADYKEPEDSICSESSEGKNSNLNFGDSRISSEDQKFKNIEEKILYNEPDYKLISKRGHSSKVIDIIKKLLNKRQR